MLEHGGALRTAAIHYRIPLHEWLDLSTGINPNGWTVPMIPAAVWQRLPESDDGLEAAAKAYYDASFLLPTAGSQAVIQALPLLRKPCRVGVIHPAYVEHAQAWWRAGHQVELLAAENIETLDAAIEHLDVLVIINPNNPTGIRFTTTTLLDWYMRLARRGGWLVVDEAFMDVTPADSLANHTGLLSGLIVLRSLGKFFGLAGARVGFALAEPAVLKRLQEHLGPWPVSGASRWVAMQALADHAWQDRMRRSLTDCGSRLADMLERQGLPVTGGTGLFQWLPLPDAAFWRDALARRGILVRCFKDLPGLRFGLPGQQSDWRRLELALSAVRMERLESF
ncbi:MAG: threonine-phosphate decarboxylase [Candidatus Contendobacter odensis]|uniref:threonine-phosphate decarboxylase n=1 Tax=Candidatus Contendibacter odensensis TaxID=1400860 RepID=A0A2G6PFD6_9GAMM|nr:MAG: threonine-phosphate decarboxylase [Candidatus Contendobacter odensis]